MLMGLMGKAIKVAGDGLCWMYAFLASLNAMQNAEVPTTRDYCVVREFLKVLHGFVRDGGCPWLEPKERETFLAIKPPPYKGRETDSYGGVTVAYRVIAAFTGISIIVVDAPSMKEKIDRRDGNIRRGGDHHSLLPHPSSLLTPNS